MNIIQFFVLIIVNKIYNMLMVDIS